MNIQNWTTANGARVLFTERHELPMVDIAVIFYAGSARDGKSFGLASFTNSMLDEGTKTLTADQIADQVDQIGAGLLTTAGHDVAIVFLRCLTDPKILPSAQEVFVSVLTEPAFPEKEFERVQEQILAEIQEKGQDPKAVVSDEFYKNLYGDLPYGHPVIGTAETIVALKPKDLQKFYQTYYNAKNAIVVVVGDLTRPQAEELVEKIVAKLPSGKLAEPLPKILEKTKATTTHIDFPATQTNVVVGQIGITLDDPDYFPLSVGNYILGAAGLVSELNKEVREKRGLVYSITSDFDILQNPAPFTISFGASNEKTPEALSVSLEKLKHFVQSGPTNEQLVAAKNSLINIFPLAFVSNADVYSKLATIGIHNLPLDYYDNYVNKIKAVTLEQVRDAFRRRVDLNNLLTVTVGKSDGVDETASN